MKTTTPTPQPLLSFSTPREGLQFNQVTLFKDVHFTWNRGEHWGLLGPNNCGKSVFIQLLSGALYHAKASLEYHFQGPHHEDPERAIAVVSLERQSEILSDFEAYVQMRWNASEEDSSPCLAEFLSQDAVEEILPYELVTRSRAAVARYQKQFKKITQSLHLSHLLERHFVALSNGETRRALLARALLQNPKLILFDAPYLGLDSNSKARFSETIHQLTQSNSQHVLIASVREDELPPSLTHLLELAPDGSIRYQGPIQKHPIARTQSSSLTQSHSPARTSQSAQKIAPAHFVCSGPPSRTKPLVEMKQVSVSYNQSPVFEPLDWTLSQGEHWLLTGPNGSGKTTLLALIIGDHPQAYSNNIRIFGRQRGTGESIWSIKKRIGWVSPELHACMDPSISVLDVVLSGFDDTTQGTSSYSSQKRKKARETLQQFDLLPFADARFGELSSGSQRLVLLARALVKNPPLLVLDEPCQNLDQQHRTQLIHHIDTLCQDPSLTLLYVTHLSDTIPHCIDHTLHATSSAPLVPAVSPS